MTNGSTLAILVWDSLSDPSTTIDTVALQICASDTLGDGDEYERRLARRVLDWTFQQTAEHWAMVKLASRDLEEHRILQD
jgi:hypothetical protein